MGLVWFDNAQVASRWAISEGSETGLMRLRRRSRPFQQNSEVVDSSYPVEEHVTYRQKKCCVAVVADHSLDLVHKGCTLVQSPRRPEQDHQRTLSRLLLPVQSYAVCDLVLPMEGEQYTV